MPPHPGHRAGLAIVRIERESDDERRILLRVTTVDDVTRPEREPEPRPFADVETAMAYLRAWLDTWARLGDAGVTGT